MFFSPLRYPGGKRKLSGFIEFMIERYDIQECTYIEPFAGGAGVAIALLVSEKVSKVVLNDKDRAVYSFWRSMLTETEEFIERVNTTPLNIEEWEKQRNVYLTQKRYSFDLGFAAFYLNRTNRSGIITARPIGGLAQSGTFKMDARFNRKTLIDRIKLIAKCKQRIHLYNKDALSLINNYIPFYIDRAFIYFDPPYFNKGNRLYQNSYTLNDHTRLANKIKDLTKCHWIVTYDNAPEIRAMYHDHPIRQYDINYSASTKGRNSEIIIFRDPESIPAEKDLISYGINISR